MPRSANQKTLRHCLTSGYFLDRLRGLPTLVHFHQAQRKHNIFKRHVNNSACVLWKFTFSFSGSAVLEFFTALSIALVAVYFGFSYSVTWISALMAPKSLSLMVFLS